MITDKTARRIACDWHGGGGTALYALCSTGTVDGNGHGGIGTEIRRCIAAIRQAPTNYPRKDREDLEKLLAYVHANGNRGPVVGWSKLSW